MSKFLDQHDHEDETPRAFIQYKGTDLCMDFYCECGAQGHFDGYFAYVVKCPVCEQEWEMPPILTPRKRCEATHKGHTAKMLEVDHDDDGGD